MKKNKKVLIAEDDNFLSEVYVTKLVSEGFDVLLAQDGEEALKIAKKEIPDTLLLDIFMPAMNGIEVLKKVKTIPALAKVNILVLTNANEKEFLDQARKLGVRDYLIKSHFTPDEVVEKIKQILKKTKK
jgi:two-component system, OmpR family, alkaline phosphatase synthesis response regulator PhoP